MQNKTQYESNSKNKRNQLFLYLNIIYSLADIFKKIIKSIEILRTKEIRNIYTYISKRQPLTGMKQFPYPLLNY